MRSKRKSWSALGPQDWRRRPPPDLRLWVYAILLVVLVARDQPGLALLAVVSILVGLLFAWLMSRARRNNAPISIIDRQARR